ncbi:MAG: ABC transporter ATP-binding protein [Lachnospiraceae bacterium]|nr:ABC transporter ATP-binding protein [Lachnospiraceae bacterium]
MLEVCDIKKSFHSKQVLKGITFSVSEGEIVCLLGNNGSGKTTTINCILKMLKADKGVICFDGKDISKYNNKEYFSKVSALLESSVNVYDYLTGRQNIEYFAELMGISAKNNLKLEKYVSVLEMEQALEQQVGEYSRGMQQKLALIIALMSSPKLLLLDEPTLGLDIKSKLSVIHTLNEIVKEEKMAVILTTHQMDVVQKLDARILILKDGKVSNFDVKNYESTENYIVSYVEDNIVKNETVEGMFKDIYARYFNKEIIEIKRKVLEIEEIIKEALDETD